MTGRRGTRFSRSAGRTIAIALALFLAGVIGLAADIVAFTGRSDASQADAAIVLGAAVDDDAPSPVFSERLRHAAELFDSGQVKWIVVTGGVGQGDTLAESEAGSAWLIGSGIPADRILIETQSRTTKQNLVFVRPLLSEHDINRVLIVSDPLHMRRAMRMADDLRLDAHPSPTPTSRFQTLGTQLPMLLREMYFSVHYYATRQ
ncbi:YdcF family protein [Mycolicibacterium gadium]|uniref:YdcF family protein n=1 Tax=Mycolicibacterium gadium TaxID=1794 RepID=A0ABT6GYJ0_MYCGU|nr:YdcF family protein [Mycolicibacterium gadium]MDG5486224.1 YdcF family protein [Mycolicibacterium gadium]